MIRLQCDHVNRALVPAFYRFLQAQEEEAAKKRAEIEAQRKAEEEAKKAEEPAQEPKNDAEMKDAPAEGTAEEQKQ